MRMFLLLTLLLCPLSVYAVVDEQDCAPNNYDTCIITSGCYYDSFQTTCRRCDETYYCLGDGTNIPRECPTEYHFSVKGSENAHECFQSPITCKKADDSDDNQCRHYNTTTDPYRCGDNHDISAHMENNQCYYNTRNCDKFGTPIGCDGGAIAGTALWLTNDREWYITGDTYYCQCEQSNVEYPDAFCTATTITRPTSGNPTSANAQITYGNVSSYYCTQCPPGHYVHIENGFMPTLNCTGGNAVCVCDIVDAGHYSQGCGPFSNNITNHSFCPYQDCPYGQTSPEGATQITDCHYTGQTQFCDSKGCFTLGNDAQNWHALY